MFFKKKEIPVIDATKGMAKVIDALARNYNIVCKYKEIMQIPEADRLNVLMWIWQRWEKHTSKKQLKQAFPNYSADLIYNIFLTENARVNMYYRQKEFTDNFSSQNPMVYITYFDMPYHQYLCTIKDIPDVFNYLIENRELSIEITQAPQFLTAPAEYFLDENDYGILYIWENGFIPKTPEQLKDYCRKNKCAYPFKN